MPRCAYRALRLALRLALVVAAVRGAGAQQKSATAISLREFRIDASHTDVAFSIPFLGHPVRGRFDDVKGTIVYVPGALERSSVTVVIGTASVNTGSKHRDEHLRSSDFFGATAFPAIVFRSRSIAKKGKGFVATGALSMHGVTRDVAIPFTETMRMYEDPHGNTLVFFSGRMRLARRDFGVLGGSRFNDWFDAARSATMGDSADITLDVAGWDPDYLRNRSYDKQLAGFAAKGVATTLLDLRAAHAKSPNQLKDAEWDFDQVGKALLQRGRPADAVEILRFNTELFPRSAAAHASLARAYEVAGDRAAALSSTKRALGLDSLNARALELERRLH